MGCIAKPVILVVVIWRNEVSEHPQLIRSHSVLCIVILCVREPSPYFPNGCCAILVPLHLYKVFPEGRYSLARFAKFSFFAAYVLVEQTQRMICSDDFVFVEPKHLLCRLRTICLLFRSHWSSVDCIAPLNFILQLWECQDQETCAWHPSFVFFHYRLCKHCDTFIPSSGFTRFSLIWI